MLQGFPANHLACRRDDLKRTNRRKLSTNVPSDRAFLLISSQHFPHRFHFLEKRGKKERGEIVLIFQNFVPV